VVQEGIRLDLRAGGLQFAALAWGPEDGPLALCLHGYPDTARTWRHLGPYLAARGWRAVAPYMRGYAPSALAPDGDYSVAALAGDAVALRDVLGGDERAVLVGHDWGAAATYGAADAFRRAVTIAVAPPPVLMSVREPRVVARQLRLSWYMLFQQLPGVSERSLSRVIPKLWRDWSPGYDGRADVRDVLASLHEPGHATAALRYYRALRPGSLNGAMPSVPLLYLHGERDGCQLPEVAARAAGVLRAPSRFEMVSGAGHFLQLERPDHVNALIADFLEGG
jgi:pimeloyl-ACP methyl ester carboxylesterase